MSTKAIVIQEGCKAAVAEVPKPKLRDDYVLVRVKAVGVNPTDAKAVDRGLAEPGARVGCDYVGIVEEVGSNVTKPFKKGDRIAGFAHGCNPSQHEDGAFAEYIVVKGDLQINIPDNMTDEEAATIGVSITTVGQGLYKSLKLPLPTKPAKEPFPILIYGGTTATGIFGIQFAKLSGLTVAATGSPQNHDYLRSLGADAVFDYRSPTCAADIKKWAGGKGVRYAWDCIGNGQSTEICGRAMCDDEEGGVYGTILTPSRETLLAANPHARCLENTLGYDIFGEPYIWYHAMRAARPDEFEFAKTFWEIAHGLLEEGKLQIIRRSVNRGGSGLEGVLKGLDEVRAGNVSGEKLVYTL